MKKFFFFLFLTISMWGFGQTKSTNGISIYTGAGTAGVFGGDNFSLKMGYLVGIEKNVTRLGDKSMFNAGINLSFQGAGYNETIVTEPIATNYTKSTLQEDIERTGKINLTYLNLPFMYRYQNETGLFLEAGIQPGFLLKASDIPDEGASIDMKEKVKFVNIDLPIGIGFWMTQNWSIGARGIYGLTNLSSNGAAIHSSTGNHQNFLLVGMLRYNIHKNP
jgi:hypothetical protein